MSRLILSILLVVALVKITVPAREFAYRYDLFELTEDEEGKLEKGDYGKAKHPSEDQFYGYYEATVSFFDPYVPSSKIATDQPIYISFCAKPNTPPPDVHNLHMFDSFNI